MEEMTMRISSMLGSAGIVVSMAGFAFNAAAAGFALTEQGSGMGNAFAGGAAAAEDASTIFYNPAGLTQIPGRQVMVGVSALKPSIDFTNRGSVAGLGKPLGVEGSDAGQWGVIPDVYFSWAATDRLWLGIGVNAPFGLKTSYDSNWIGRYQAIDSVLTTVNVNPTVAFKVNEVVSLGAGINYQRLDATLTRAVNFVPAAEGSARVSGDASAWGWNVGALFNLGTDMRVGVSYRSQLHYRIEGDVTFNRPAGVPNAGAAADGSIFANVTVPESASLSVFQKFSDQWDFMGDITWTRWSRLEALNIYRTNGATLQAIPENWDDSWRFSLGLSYYVNPAWKLRGGVAYDQSPVSNQFRTARIPDSDRTWLAIGAQWKPQSLSGLAIDVGYAHLFVKDASISDNQAASGSGILIGNYSLSADIFTVQLAYSF
jgi:long-chain fatty acid transport protein